MIETELSAAAALAVLHEIEAAFGRDRASTGSNAPRTLDLDLIAWGRRIRSGPPILPHPRAVQRLFVMGPLAQILPDWRDPVGGKTVRDLAALASVGVDAAPVDA
ncbi:hypothetical protein BH09PSE2_BH09PSE2_10220 [soil metagenome]